MRRPFSWALAWFSMSAVAGADERGPSTRSLQQEPEAHLSYLPRFAFRRRGKWIQSSLRIESDGVKVRVSRRAFGPGGQPWGVAIPPHLGTGYLFFQPVASVGSSSTSIYRSATWTGKLEPVAKVPFVVSEAEFGFERVYLLGTGIQVGFDLSTKKVMGLEPIPPVVEVEAMRFLSTDSALVSAPLVGVLHTNDAGRSWTQIPQAERIVHRGSDERLFVKTNRSVHEVLPSGELGPESDTDGQQEAELLNADAELNPQELDSADERARAVSYVVTQGVNDGTRAFALGDGKIVEVEYRDGVSVHSRSVEGARFGVCQGTSMGAGRDRVSMFACQESNAELSVWRVDDGRGKDGERSVARVFGPQRRRLLAAQREAIVLSGTCEDERAKGVCVIRKDSQRTYPLGDLRPGRAAIAVSRHGLVHVELNQEEERLIVRRFEGNGVKKRSYEFSPDEKEMLTWGSLLLRGSVIDDEVAVWLVHQERFVGLRFGDSKYPSAGAVQRPLSRASFAGKYALLWGAAGFAKQTVDGGLHFFETQVPFNSGDPQLSSVIARRGSVEMGCSEVGCILGRYLRFGWDTQFRLPAEEPESVRIPSPGGGKLHFLCGRGHFESPPRLPTQSEELPGFWEEHPPLAPEGHERFGIDFSEGAARLFGFGPKDTPWGRQGRIQLYFVDPFRPEAVKKSAATLRLFPSAMRAQEELGVLDRVTSTSEIDFDPEGDKGVFLVRTRDKAVLFSFSEGEPLVRYSSDEGEGLRGLSGAVLSGQRWYAGFAMGRRFIVVRLGALGVETIAELPMGDASARGARLIRTVSGDLGVAMEGDRGLVVYPITPDGELGQSLLVPHSSQRPPICLPEARGFIVDRTWSLTPYFATQDGGPLELNDLRARLIVGHGRPCIEAMSARTRSELPSSELVGESASTVPMGVLNHDSSRGRAEILCE